MRPPVLDEFPVTTTDATTAGEGSSRVERVGGRSEVVSWRAVAPLKLLVPRPRAGGETASVIASSYGGGLVCGDHLHLDLAIGPSARCRLGTQASTKVYRRACDGAVSRQSLRATVEEDAILAIAPDPVTCFAGAAYEQSQHINLADHASLLYIDWLTSGRWACGERWAFHSYRNRTEICAAGKTILIDALRLDSTDGPIDAPHRCGRFECIATVILLGPKFSQPGDQVTRQLAAEPLPRNRSDLIAATSPIDRAGVRGTILRIVGMGAEPVGRYIASALSGVANVLGEPIWNRKW